MKNNALIAVFAFSLSSMGIMYLHKDDDPPPPRKSWNESAFEEISEKWDKIDKKYAEKQKLKLAEKQRSQKENELNATKSGAGRDAEIIKEKKESDD